MKEQTVYVLVSEATMPDNTTKCSVAGVFTDAQSALEFTEQVINGMNYGLCDECQYPFRRLLQDDSSKPRRNFVFAYVQARADRYPIFRYECFCETVLSKCEQ